MSETHIVEQGEYLASIAKDYGFSDWHTIYDHPQNADLKKKRPNPNVLFPGDQLFIPDKQLKEESCATEKKHRFQIKVPKASLKIVLKDSDGNALSNQPYTLKIAWLEFKGTTDGNGALEQKVPIGVQTGDLHLDKLGIDWPLKIGHLDPIEDKGSSNEILSGVQARLNNLGFHCGEVDGIQGPLTESAIRAFQQNYGLTVTGTPNNATRAKLAELHVG